MEQIIYIKMDLALNNLQRLICHKTQQPNQRPLTTVSQSNKLTTTPTKSR